MKVKTGDTVRVRAGKDKGKTGKVVQVFPDHARVAVEGLNMATRHLRRASKTQAGQKIQFTSPMSISNVQVVSPVSGKPGRIGYKTVEKEGTKIKVRVLKTKEGSEDLA